MRVSFAWIAGVVIVSGCATGAVAPSVPASQQQKISLIVIDANGSQNPGGGALLQANCTITNDKGQWPVNVPGSVTIETSKDQLSITCKSDGYLDGNLTVAARIPGKTFGYSGSAYNYPERLQIMLGRSIHVDPLDYDFMQQRKK